MSTTPEADDREETPGPVAGGAARILHVAVARARRALLWENLWPLLAAIGVAIGIFLAVSWAGLWVALPPLGRLIGLAVFALIALASLVPAIWVRIPGTDIALRRLDRSSGLAHRPATAIADSLATDAADPVADALWRAHVTRASEAARRLRAGWPRPHLAARDPFALRAIVLLAVVTTFFMAGSDRVGRVAAAFDWSGVIAPKLYRVDAWVTPPAYTGRPPVLLPGIRHDAPAPGEIAAISVPSGSELVVRATGLTSVDLNLVGGITERNDEAPAPAAGSIERRFRIADHGSATLGGLPAGSATWTFRAVPDRAPVIAFTREPQVIGRSSVSLSYRVEDDYGVTGAEAQFTNPQLPAAEGGQARRPLVEAPNFPLVLPQARTRAGAGQSSKDVTEHPWAGVTATVTLIAKDEGGNEGKSEPTEISLPSRSFTKPVARALVEQRRNLAFDANARGSVGRALEALLIAPEKFTPELAIFLGIRTASTRLRLARNDDDLRSVVDYLWEIAVLIEDGTMSDAERDLRAAQDALRQALERGATDEEIRKLTDQLRQALDRFMQALAEQLRRDGTTEARPLDRNTRAVRPQDLKSMLDRIENLARSGSRDAARRMLDELQAMLDNLSRNRQARSGEQQGESDSMLDELSRMIQEQQRLRDRTYREGRDSRNERRNRNEQSRSDREQRSFGDLRRNQENLRQQLQRMLEQLRRQQQGGAEDGGDQGNEAGEALGRAEQAMRDAEGSLGQGEADGAVEGQGRALQNLRRGAQSMAEAMQGLGDAFGEPGGPQAEAAERTDPLGRPVRSREYGDDFTVKVPDEIDVQRARRVLEELRRRFGESGRPQMELDYIERLLRNY